MPLLQCRSYEELKKILLADNKNYARFTGKLSCKLTFISLIFRSEQLHDFRIMHDWHAMKSVNSVLGSNLLLILVSHVV